MEIKVDIYYRNKETHKFYIFNEIITQEDIENIAREKRQDKIPMHMDDSWEFDSISIDNINI